MSKINIISLPSPNYNSRPDKTIIDMIVIHYTGMRDCHSALHHLTNPLSEVSAHYCIDEDGTIYSLVSEINRAWHAGLSYWRGESDNNSRSIGIELVNPGHEFGYRSFPGSQMTSLIQLSLDIKKRYQIPNQNIVGHSDIAPHRKTDPGELFDWKLLSQNNLGLWPDQTLIPFVYPLSEMLINYGYKDDSKETIIAFQRHFRPHCLNGLDDHETRTLLGLLLATVQQENKKENIRTL